MKFINFDNIVNKNNENNYINKNAFVPQHVNNTIIIGQTGCSKTNLLFNILTLNPVFQKIFIFTKEPEAKYNFLIKKCPQDIKIFYQNDEYDLDKLIKGDLQTCCIFDDHYSNINVELVCQNSCILLFFCSFLDIPQILHVYTSSR